MCERERESLTHRGSSSKKAASSCFSLKSRGSSSSARHLTFMPSVAIYSSLSLSLSHTHTHSHTHRHTLSPCCSLALFLWPHLPGLLQSDRQASRWLIGHNSSIFNFISSVVGSKKSFGEFYFSPNRKKIECHTLMIFHQQRTGSVTHPDPNLTCSPSYEPLPSVTFGQKMH